MLCCYKVVLQLDFSLFSFRFSLKPGEAARRATLSYPGVAKLRGATPGYSIMRNVHPKWCYF